MAVVLKKNADVLDADYINKKGRFDMNQCRHCKWSEPCICVVCEDGTMLVCSIKHKHVEKDAEACDAFDEDDNKEEKGYYKRNETM